MIYHIRGEYSNHCNTDAIDIHFCFLIEELLPLRRNMNTY